MELIRGLYDFNFTNFVSMRVVRPIYGVLIVLFSIGGAFYVLFSLFALLRSPILGLLTLLFAVPFLLFYMFTLRMSFEALILLFDINDRVDSLGRGSAPPPPAGPPMTPPSPGAI